MNLRGQIRLKERQITQAHLAMHDTRSEFKRVLHDRLSSRTALAVGFTGGLLLGWSRRKKPRKPAKSRVRDASKQVKQSMPPHWLGSYLIWPFVLATARDYMVSRRPSRSEVEGNSNR